jgi:long-subunit fatty acid transport protein
MPPPVPASRGRRPIGFATVLALSLVAAVPATAQSNDEIQTGIQFNFSTPGARSLALGGAFLAVADDATAAYSNPAGLAQLAAPELSLEARAWSFSSLFADAGHTPLHELTGIGVDVVDGLRDGELEDRTEGLSFLSYVHARGRWAVALYRHQLADFEASLLSQGVFVGLRESTERVRPARSHLDLEIVHLGVAGAWRVSDALSVGAGVSRYDFTLDSLTERFAVEPATGDLLVDGLTGHPFGPADFRPGNVFNTQTQSGDDSELAWNAGFLWQLGARWSVGGVYRQGPDFDFTAVYVNGPASPEPGTVDPTVGGDGVFHVPDVYGVGVAYRPAESVLVSFDVDRVEYSDMTDELVNLLQVTRGEPELFRADDALELHLGFEYQALHLRYPTAFRLGVWHDPDHRIRYTGDFGIPRARFRPGDDELHLAAGVGVVIRRAQFDLAVDLSDRVDTVSLSTVLRLR